MQTDRTKPLYLALASATLFFVAGGLTQADEPLPGVNPSKSIVQPMPEPLDDDATEKQPMRVGDWDVRVSGSITVDVGAGNLTKPRR